MEPSGRLPFWRRLIQPQDVVWLLLFAALAALSPGEGLAEVQLLAALAVVQVLAPRVPVFSTERGKLSIIVLKLLIGFLLIGVTGGILSSYYPILLLPVVAAATTLGGWGTAAITLASCAADLVFLPVALHFGYQLEPSQLREVSIRILFLPVVAFLTYGLAESNRIETKRAQESARQLAEANLRLQQAEASARRAERLAALGQLTAGLAHELRNPLGTMKASSEMLTARLPAGDDIAAELADYISTEIDRVNSLITRFLDFARPLRPRFGPTDLNAVADEAVSNLQHQYPQKTLPIHRNYDPTIPTLPADAELLERLIFNLLQNALQSSPDGALITLKTKLIGDVVELAVIDRGPGIPPHLKEQIFNPFFTTRPTGTGLGLAICSQIAAEHGATLEVDSEPGQGARFTLQLRKNPRDPSSPSSSL